jgi:hypothetical protein
MRGRVYLKSTSNVERSSNNIKSIFTILSRWLHKHQNLYISYVSFGRWNRAQKKRKKNNEHYYVSISFGSLNKYTIYMRHGEANVEWKMWNQIWNGGKLYGKSFSSISSASLQFDVSHFSRMAERKNCRRKLKRNSMEFPLKFPLHNYHGEAAGCRAAKWKFWHKFDDIVHSLCIHQSKMAAYYQEVDNYYGKIRKHI